MSFGPTLAAFIRAVVGPLDYFAHHPCTVVSQAADGTVELKPDSPRVPPLKGVPLLLGLPGVSVKVATGARVRLGFDGGSPERPQAMLWEAGGLLEVLVTATVKVTVQAPQVLLGDGAAPVGRVGDAVQVTFATGTLLTAASAPVYNPVPVTVTGTITAGSPKVKA